MSRKNSAGLYKIHLFSAFVGDLALPIYYIYLPLLAYRLGASALEVGLVGGATYAIQSFMPFVMGRLSDRIGSRRILVTLALLILAVTSFIYVSIASPTVLIVTRLFEGIGWAILWPTVESGIVESYPRGATRALGLYNFVWSGAAALGPLLGAFLVFTTSIRTAFLATFALMLFAVLVNLSSFSLVGERTRKSENRTREDAEIEATTPQMKEAVRQENNPTARPWPSSNWFYMIATSVGSLSGLVALTFFSPYAGEQGISAAMIGLITFSYGAARFGTYFLCTKETLRRRLLHGTKRGKNVILSLGVVSLPVLLFLLHGSAPGVYFLAFALVGVGYSLTVTVTQVVLIAEVPASRIGSGAGTFESSVGIGAAIGPAVAGVISGSYLPLAFVLPAIVFTGVALSYSLLIYRNKARTGSPI